MSKSAYGAPVMWAPCHVGGIAAAGAPDSLFLPSKSHLSICPHLVPACPELSFAPVSILRLMLTGTHSGSFLDSMWFPSALPSQPGLGVSAAPSSPTSAASSFWPLSWCWQLGTEGNLSCRTGWTLVPSSAELWPQGRKQGLLCAGAGQPHLPKPV